MKNLSWQVHPDGSFDLLGAHIQLRGAYPSMDGRPLHPHAVQIARSGEGTVVEYLLDDGLVRLHLLAEPQGQLLLRSEIVGRRRWPDWFHPLAGAEVCGANRLFLQGIGFSGPSHFFVIPGDGTLFSRDSYLATGFIQGHACLAVGSLEHRRFLHQTTIANEVEHFNFRHRETVAHIVRVKSGFRTEGIACENVDLPTLLFQQAGQPWEALRGVAGRIGRENHARIGQPTYHWCSWYDRGSYFTREELDRFLEGAHRLGEPLHAVQIDDGYCTHGDWLEPNEKWPGGLEEAFSAIRKNGYRPGIWIAPFMVESRSRLFAAHPDWMLRRVDGSLLVTWKNYDVTRRSEEYYVLDTSHPEALEYLRQVFLTFRRWGAEFFKTDFLEWGYRDHRQVRRFHPGKTEAQYYDEVLRTIREAIGEESHWLGCIAFFAPHTGYCDSMRMTSDTGTQWGTPPATVEGPEGGVPNVVHETYHTLYLNNLLFQNDPDALYLRHRHLQLSETEIRTLAWFFGILGVSINTSDQLTELREDRLRLWRFLRPQETPWTAELPRFGREKYLWTVLRRFAAENGWALLVLNPGSESQPAHLAMGELTGLGAVTVFLWNHLETEELGIKSMLHFDLEPHEAKLFYLSPTGTPPPNDLTLGGWRG